MDRITAVLRKHRDVFKPVILVYVQRRERGRQPWAHSVRQKPLEDNVIPVAHPDNVDVIRKD
ncbi:hypothetical protein D3C75_1137770 [compost metagenome]